MRRCVEPGLVGGRIRAPASKSAMQRAIACAALANGESTITNLTMSDDAEASLRVVAALGARVEREPGRIIIRGREPASWPLCESVSVSCGEAGLCLRMFSAVAALAPFEVELRGEGSLARRPVGMVEAPLRALGAACRTSGGLQPVVVRGPLRPGRVAVDASESSQFLTGLLIALGAAGGPSEMTVERLSSGGYLGLTVDVMRAFGAELSVGEGGRAYGLAGTGYAPAAYEVEGDWSGAAFLLVAGVVAGRPDGLVVEGLSAGSSQPDRAILAALRAAGARVEDQGSAWRVLPGPLSAFSFDATDCPDLFPPLVALASRCEGVTTLRGARRLRAKESDRAAALSEEFSRVGLDVRVDGDLMTVRGLPIGGEAASGARLAGGEASSRGDHRIAMALAVAALAGSGPVGIEGAECVAKSYPGFFDDLGSLTRA